MQFSHLFTLALGATMVTAAPVIEQESQIAKRTDTKFIKDILDAHNFFRKQHGAPDIKWDQKLADFGQGVTNGCVFKHSVSPISPSSPSPSPLSPNPCLHSNVYI